MKNKITLFAVIAFFVSLLAIIGCNQNQSKGKTFSVGIINPTSGLNRVVEGFMNGMAQKGYIEGKNISYLYDGPLGSKEKITPTARKFIANKVDLIYTLTTPGTKIVKELLKDTNIPIVFAPVFSPISSGIVDSRINPNGNITGIKIRGSSEKALYWLLQILPSIKNIYIPFHYTDNAAKQTVEDLSLAAKKVGIKLTTTNLATIEELDIALAQIPENTDAIWLTCSHLLFSNIKKIVKRADEMKLPIAASTSLHEFGVLVSYGEENYKLGQQASRIADIILQGTPTKDVPIENADYYLGINLQAEKKLGIKIPDTVLKSADFIVR